MRELGLLALFALILWSSMLYGEIEYSLTELTTLNTPYPFDEVFYDEDIDTEVHFYKTGFEPGIYALYHFSMNDSMQFSERTMVVSYPIEGIDFDEFELTRLYNSDVFHYYAKSDYQHERFITKIENYNQATATFDIHSYNPELEDCVSVCDSLALVSDRHWDLDFANGYCDTYKINLNTNTISLFNTNPSRLNLNCMVADHLLTWASYPYYHHYTDNLTYVDSLYINEMDYPFWNPESVNGAIESFQDGLLMFYMDGIVRMDGNVMSYARFTPGALSVERVGNYSSHNYSIVSESRVVGIGQYDEFGSVHCLSYNDFDGINWNGSEPIFLYGEYSLYQIDDYLLVLGSSEYRVYDFDLNLLHQSGSDSRPFFHNYPFSFNDKIFFSNYLEGTIHYYTFSTTVPNSEVVNPVINNITTSNYPNPFNPETTIEYSVPTTGNVEISVYNILGQKVNTLVNIDQPKGTYNVVWDGTDKKGYSLSSGVYFYRVEQNGKSITNKIVLMK